MGVDFVENHTDHDDNFTSAMANIVDIRKAVSDPSC